MSKSLASPALTVSRTAWFWIVFIALAAAVLRIAGIWHDYPFSFYGDEQQMVKQALAYGSGDLNPYRTGMNASKPAFYPYLLFFEYGIYFVIGKLAGWWQDATGYVLAFLYRPGPWYVIGRVTTALFGIATVVLVGATGERYFGRNTGVVAAIIVTLAVGHVITCQDVKADNPTAFFSLLAVWFLLGFVNSEKFRDLLLASVAAGFGIATKYYSVFLAPLFLIAIVVVATRRGRRPGDNLFTGLTALVRYTLISVVIGMATFFVLTPYTFLDSQGLDFLLGELSVLGDKAVQLSGTEASDPSVRQDYEIRGYANYSTAVLDFGHSLGKLSGFGLLGAVAGIIGLIFCLLRFSTNRMLLITFPLLFSVLAILVRPGFAVVRHQTQIYPFLALSAAIVLVALYGLARSRGRWVGRGAIAVFVLALAPQFVTIVQRADAVSRLDPRSAAVTWINENLKIDDHILIGNRIIELPASTATLLKREKLVVDLLASGEVPDSVVSRTTNMGQRFDLQKKLAAQKPAFTVDGFEHPWWLRHHNESGERFFLSERDVFMEPPTRKFGVASIEEYRQRGVKYLVLGDQYREFYKQNANRYPPYNAFYEAVYALPEIAVFERHASGWGGNSVRIFQLPE